MFIIYKTPCYSLLNWILSLRDHTLSCYNSIYSCLNILDVEFFYIKIYLELVRLISNPSRLKGIEREFIPYKKSKYPSNPFKSKYTQSHSIPSNLLRSRINRTSPIEMCTYRSYMHVYLIICMVAYIMHLYFERLFHVYSGKIGLFRNIYIVVLNGYYFFHIIRRCCSFRIEFGNNQKF